MEPNNDFKPYPQPVEGSSNNGKFLILGGALAVALVGNGYLLIRSNNMAQEVNAIREAHNTQMAKYNESIAAAGACKTTSMT